MVVKIARVWYNKMYNNWAGSSIFFHIIIINSFLRCIMSTFAIWLDTFFADFDRTILTFWHAVAESEFGQAFFTPFMKFVSWTGNKGIIFIIMGLILLFFKNTRKSGTCVLLSMIFGLLITNILLKGTIARIRPFNASELYREFWTFVGQVHVGETSFPSGHTTSAMAAMLALCLTRGKKYIPICIIEVALMGISRNHLMVHYPSDILGGVLAGAISAIFGFLLTNAIFKLLESKKHNKAVHLVLDWDVLGTKRG